jgi:hypothetical protein
VTPHTLVHIPGATGYGLKVQRASSRMPYPCALSIPYSTGLILCVHWNRPGILRCCVPMPGAAGRTWHILHGVNHQGKSGPVHQPSSSLALGHDPVSPPDGKYGNVGCWPAVPPVHKLGVKRESRAAACARCAARGAQCRGTLAACPLCGAQSSCRRWCRAYDSWHRIIFIYQGHTIEER